MNQRGRLYTTYGPTEVRQYNAANGFITCLAAMRYVEDGGDAALLHLEENRVNLPTPFARMLERVALGLHNAPAPFVGNWGAKVLLVGDQPSYGKSASLPNWPFISAIATGCSAWLTEKLEHHGISELDLCWVNAYARDSRPTGYRQHIAPGQFQKIITLGKRAHYTMDLPHEQAYHPQYWKRFHHGHPYYLIQQIKEALK